MVGWWEGRETSRPRRPRLRRGGPEGGHELVEAVAASRLVRLECTNTLQSRVRCTAVAGSPVARRHARVYTPEFAPAEATEQAGTHIRKPAPARM